MPDGERLERAMRKAVELTKGSEEEIYLRTYEVQGGHAESGTPPDKTPVDVVIFPRPAVSDALAAADRLGERQIGGVQILAGDKRLTMAADAPVETGSILHFDNSDWRVVALSAPAVFGKRQLLIALARKVQE